MIEWTFRQLFRRIGRRQTGRLRRWLPATLAAVAVLAVVATGYASLANGFPWVITAIERWNDTHVVRRTGEASGVVFNRLVEDRQIVFDKTSGKLDLRIDCEAEQAGFGKSDPAQKQIVDRLCDSDPGSAIQNELKVWNRNLSILAIRDNHRTAAPGGEGCDNGKNAAFVIPEGCHPSIWDLGIQRAQGDSTLDARLRDPPSAEVHGYLSRPVRSGFGDWSQFDTAVVGPGVAVLQARFAAAESDRTITVDLIGDIDSVQIDGQFVNVARRLYCHGGLSESRCREIVARDRSVPHAWRLAIPLVRDRSVRVVLRARSIPVVPIVLSDLGTLEEDKRPVIRNAHFRADETVRLTTNIALACQIVSPEEFESGEVVRYIGSRAGNPANTPDIKKYCEPVWNTSQVGSRTQTGTVQINAAGGDKVLALTEVQRPAPTSEAAKGKVEPTVIEETVPTSDTVRLGLLPVVGLGSADRYSLLGQAVRRARSGDKPPELSLTIDPELQSVAYQRLSNVISRKPGTEALTASFVPGAEAIRRGAVILIDAGMAQGGDNGGGYDTDAGRILTAATWPQLPAKPAHAWDALASDNYRPTSSPLAARAWSQNDKHYQPGSTFKPLIALAAIERAARGEATFLRALGLGRGENGGLTEQEIPSVFGKQYNFSYRSTALRVSTGDDGEPTHEITNAGETALCHMINGTSACPRDGRIGLRAAITTSSNMFFARLALLVDEERVVRRAPDNRLVEIKAADPANPLPPLAIERLARRLVPGKRFDLAPGFAERFGAPPTAGSRTYATPITIDASRLDRPRRLTLALAGIGQATQATPLAMASIMASIATGRIVRPRITPEAAKPNSTPEGNAAAAANVEPEAAAGDDLLDLNSTQGGERPIQQGALLDLMTGLRSSLHNVVLNGTAASAFARSPLRSRIYGKTGTAQTGNDEASTNSVWFIGWIDGLGQQRWRDRRIAFACLVTHIAQQGDAAAGGKVCAPIIEQILAEYERTASRS
jgi:cell division protein FtsI/penicillin-binding protein 2